MSELHRQIYINWPDQGLIEVTHAYGYLRAGYDDRTGTMLVTDFQVEREKRSRGIGGALLATTRDSFLANGGRRMVADITSRPCADSMRRVFGTDAVTSIMEGAYLPDDPTYVPPAIARLDYTPLGSTGLIRPLPFKPSEKYL